MLRFPYDGLMMVSGNISMNAILLCHRQCSHDDDLVFYVSFDSICHIKTMEG